MSKEKLNVNVTEEDGEYNLSVSGEDAKKVVESGCCCGSSKKKKEKKEDK